MITKEYCEFEATLGSSNGGRHDSMRVNFSSNSDPQAAQFEGSYEVRVVRAIQQGLRASMKFSSIVEGIKTFARWKSLCRARTIPWWLAFAR